MDMTFDALKQKMKTINAINITPFDDQGRIDWNDLRNNIDYLIRGGISMIYPCGNTGEFYSLTLQEAMEVTRKVVEYASGRATIIAGIGYDVQTACEMAKHAEAVGADGVMIHQPINPYMLNGGLLAYYQKIVRSTRLPVTLYVKSEQVGLDVLREISREPNVVGVKYAVNNLPLFAKTVKTVGNDIVWICGTAEMWAPFFFAAGAEGFTSGMVNVDTGRSFAMLAALKANRYAEAMDIWEDLRQFEELREKNSNGNNVSVVKEAMRQLGMCSGKVRPPITELQPNEKEMVRQVLVKWGLLQ